MLRSQVPISGAPCILSNRLIASPNCSPLEKRGLITLRRERIAPSAALPDAATVTALVDLTTTAATTTTTTAFDVAALDSAATAGIASLVLRPVFSISSLLMIVRIVLTWYPEIDGNVMPWSIAFKPTEPLLAATRKVVKPFNGLDVSPIVWVAILSFLSEILTGPQGILSLLQRKGI